MLRIIKFIRSKFEKTAELIQGLMPNRRTPPRAIPIRVAAGRLPPPANAPRKF